MNNTKKHTVLRVIISLIIIIIIFTATIMLVPGDKLMSASSLMHHVNRVFGGSSSLGENFEFPSSVDNVFAEINGMLVIGSGSGLYMYDMDGTAIASSNHNMPNPAISDGKNKAAVWDIGGNKLSIIDNTGNIEALVTQGRLISVSVNKNDWLAVTSEESGYKGAVTVYNEKLSPVYKWYSGEGYLMDGEISPDCGTMSAVTLTERGSRIISFSLSSEEEKASYLAENQLILDIKFLSNSRLCALLETKLIILNENLELVAEYSYVGEHLKGYSLDGNGFAVLLLGTQKAGGTGRLVTIDADGRQLGSIDVEGELISISAAGRYLAAVYIDKTVIYNLNLSEYGDLAETAGVRAAIMCTDGTAVIISGYGAAVFTP